MSALPLANPPNWSDSLLELEVRKNRNQFPSNSSPVTGASLGGLEVRKDRWSFVSELKNYSVESGLLEERALNFGSSCARLSLLLNKKQEIGAMAPPVEGLTECLYDTLGVERTVDPDKLKIAYRKMAMKWHPDKIQQSGAGASADAYQKATERFQQINRAYEVLSDPVERTWYDSHRERILSASSSSANAAPGEFDLNLWPYFSPSAFSGFGETGNGFYAVYSAIFKKIHMQDQVFGRMYGNGDVSEAPELGTRETPHQNVYSFYRYWQGFSSVKDFAWCDKYDTLQAPNRKVRRLMEEENNKVRKRERKEFNNSVRQLASFVKKRDKRVIEKQLELQKEQRQKELDRKARQLALEKEKQEQIRLYKEQAWTVPDEEEEWETEDESDDDDGTVKMEKTAEDLECMICGKRFKSVKQLQNHERSKKHLENLAALKGAFRNDDEQVERLGKQLGIDISIQKKSKQKKQAPVASEEPDDSDDLPVTREDESDREPTNNELEVSEEEEDDDDNMLASMLKFQSRHASASNEDTVVSDSGQGDEEEDEDEEEEEDEESVVASMSKLQVNKQPSSDAQVNKQPSSDAQGNKQASSDADEEAGVNDDSVVEEEDEKQVKKGKSRRRAKQDRKQAAVSNRFSASASEQVEATNGDAAAAAATSDTGGPSSTAAPPPPVKHSKLAHRGKKIKKEKKGAKQDSHTCQTCGEDFDSRSQLFKHIAATNHAILKSK